MIDETRQQNKTSEAQLRAIKKYEDGLKDKIDNIRIRVPKGWKDMLQEYVKEHPDYNSVNALLCDLIAKELKIENNGEN